MHKLTSKQECFCLGVVEGLSASDAYRRCYNVGNRTSATVGRAAKTLMDNAKIAARIDELRAPVRQKVGLTLESHLRRLEELADRAEEREQLSAAVNAEVHRGKAAGLYVNRQRLEGPGGGPIQVQTQLVVGPEILRALERILSRL